MDKTLNEYYLSTYDFKFTPSDFLKALEFYLKTLDDLDVNMINKKTEFINRKELYQIRDFFK